MAVFEPSFWVLGLG